jgi:hypothetical protein
VTHTRALADEEGRFSRRESAECFCRRCKSQTVECELWESHCGAYEDHRYTCTTCGHVWWIDGIDS